MSGRSRHVTNPKEIELVTRFSRASGYGLFNRPVRFLVLEQGTLALMEEAGGALWQIFMTEYSGNITLTPKPPLPPYKLLNIAEMAFRDLADELSGPELDRLFETAQQYRSSMDPQEISACVAAAIKYFRVRRADEDGYDADMAKSKRDLE